MNGSARIYPEFFTVQAHYYEMGEPTSGSTLYIGRSAEGSDSVCFYSAKLHDMFQYSPDDLLTKMQWTISRSRSYLNTMEGHVILTRQEFYKWYKEYTDMYYSPTYKRGQIIRINNTTDCMLAHVGERKCTLVSLYTGNLWAEPIKCKDTSNVSHAELLELKGMSCNSFTVVADSLTEYLKMQSTYKDV